MRNDVFNLTVTELFGLALRAHFGASSMPDINLVQNSSANILADLNGAQQAEAAYQSSVSALVPRNNSVATAVDTSYVFCQRTRDVLKTHCGNQYCLAWNSTGFIGSLEVPTGQDELRVLLGSLQTYFAATPAHQNAPLNVTTVRVGELIMNLDTARNAVTAQKALIESRRLGRDEAVQALRVRLRGLADELKQLIGRKDRRWRVFGLNIPAEPETPGRPQQITVSAAGPGQLLVRCEPVAYAERYRFWSQEHGAMGEASLAVSSDEPFSVIDGLPTGSLWQVWVSAVNANGAEGPRSEPVEGSVSAQAVA